MLNKISLLSRILIAALLLNVFHLVGSLPYNKAEASIAPASCQTVSSSVYAAVYSVIAPDAVCTQLSDYEYEREQTLNLSNLGAGDAYEFVVKDTNFNGQSIKIVDGNGTLRTSGVIDSNTSLGRLTNISVNSTDLLFLVIGDYGDSQKIIPIGFFSDSIKLVRIDVNDPNATFNSLKLNGEVQTWASPTAGHYFILKDVSSLFGSNLLAVLEKTITNVKQYYLAKVGSYWSEFPFDQVIREKINISDLWPFYTSSFGLSGETPESMSIRHHFGALWSDDQYDIKHPIIEYNQNISYYIDPQLEWDMGSFYEYVEIQTATHQYILGNPTTIFSSEFYPIPNRIDNSVPMSQVNFSAVNSQVSDLKFKLIPIKAGPVSFEEDALDFNLDRNKTFAFSYAFNPYSLSYNIGDYWFVRDSEFLRSQVVLQHNATLILGADVQVLEALPDEEYDSEYYLSLRTSQGDIAQNIGTSGVKFQLYQGSTPIGSEMDFGSKFYVASDDEKPYFVQIVNANLLDSSIVKLLSTTADIPLVKLHVSILNDSTGQPTTSIYANQPVVLVDDYNPFNYYDLQTNEAGDVVIRGFGHGKWKVKTIANTFELDYTVPFIQTNNVEIDGLNFRKENYENVILNVVPTLNRSNPSDLTPLNIGDVVRFSQKIVPNQFDFNQDGTSDANDYNYLMTLIKPFMIIPR
ncbi:hypothetical protein [Paenibacillus sp. HJGM_3]|uniref:hypothetical protein n=1 Tax=Paenibacillus sp. HJGM_3 TaxID=3379816 RepID=UPI00385FD8B1